MKNFRLFVCILFCSSRLPAQDTAYIQPGALGVHVFIDRFVQTDRPTVTGIALSYLRGITPRTDINATLAGSFPSSFGHGQEESKLLMLEADVSLREKLFRGKRLFNPFLMAGLGVARYSIYYGAFLPAGIGLQTNLPGEMFLLLNGQYRIPLTNTQPGHYYLSLGIAGIIGKKKRRVVTQPVILPPRSDASAKDTDGDGITDSLDACPFAAGLQSFEGCPDTDGDGIPDRTDKCPLIRGIPRLQGCPEPDRDKDGIIDSLDKCPDLPGFGENEGCPAVGNDLRKKIELAARNVFFETDKYALLSVSFKSLDEVAVILQQNPYLKLDIAGHTDNSGTPEKNQTLSEQRANAVLEYLQVKKAISKERLSALGYGATRPLTGNDTPEGRAINRRVEFRLRY